MKLTNKLGLPEALVQAVANDPYNKGDADFSVTELLQPPRIRTLSRFHRDDMEEDVADRLWSLYGQIAHLILERANKDDLAETRFYANIGGYRISGQIDTLSQDGVLSDFKFTTVYKFMADKEPSPEWAAQLNMQAWLLAKNGKQVNQLQIIGLLRDWRPGEAAKNKRYPNTQIAKMQIGFWAEELTEKIIMEGIRRHKDAEHNIPLCTEEETWNGKRCKSYCPCAKFCEQYQATL